MQTIIINRPGLTYAAITVAAGSTAGIAEQPIGSQMWRGLMVDSRFYPLVLCKHVNANPQAMVEATDAALADVQAAIAALRPSTIDLAIEAALERLSQDHAEEARRARRDGDLEAKSYFQRAANAYAKALLYYRQGVRPESTPGGGWLLPSQRPSAAPHLLTRDGDWVCTCEAGVHIHWASALIVGIEVAFDDLDSGVSGESDPPPEDDAPRGIDDTENDEECPTDGPTDYGRVGAYVTGLLVTSIRDRISAARARQAAVVQDW